MTPETTMRELLRELRAALTATYEASPEGRAYLRRMDEAIGAVKFGCHWDLDTYENQEPDGCVFDDGDIEDCIYATKLDREGKGKNDCEYWKPIRARGET